MINNSKHNIDHVKTTDRIHNTSPEKPLTRPSATLSKKEILFDNPSPALRASSPTRGEVKAVLCAKYHKERAENNSEHPVSHVSQKFPKSTKSHHQYRTANMKQLARSLRRNKTPQEAKLWNRLRNNQLGFKFYRQYLIANQYIADFVCLEKKLIIEVDGSQHAQNESDQKRTWKLEKCGFQVVRFWNNQINQHLNDCVAEIYQRLHGKIV